MRGCASNEFDLRRVGIPRAPSSSGWANGVPCKNFASVFAIDLESTRKRLRPYRLGVPRIVRLLEQAVEFQAQLDLGQVRFRVQLAAANGLSAMRVSNILALLKLAPSILEFIRSLPAGTPPKATTERGLRALTRLPHSDQVLEARRRFPGFARFLAGGAVAAS